MNHPPRPAFHFAAGITGHRPPLMDPEAATRVRPRLEAALNMLAGAARAVHSANASFFAESAPVLRLVTPLAEGADQLAAEAALAAGFEIQAVLPLPRDDYVRDFSGVEAQASFREVLASASQALELPPRTGARAAAYALAGRATLAHSDLLIAVWDGEAAKGRGGTGEVVAAALRRGMPVIHVPIGEERAARILWPGYELLIDPDEAEAVPSRALSQAALLELLTVLLAPPAGPRERRFLERFFAERERRVRPRVEYPLLLAALGVRRPRAAMFRTKAYAEETAEEWSAFREAAGDGRNGVLPDLNAIEASYCWSDRLAQHFAQIYRSGHVMNFTLAAAAVLLALSGLLFPKLKLWIALAELGAIGGFVLNTRIGVAQEWHRRWLDYRQLAERLRPMRSLKLLAAASPPGRRGARAGAERWLDWYAAAVWRASGCPSGRLTDEAVLSRLVVHWELRPQVDYHRAAALQMRRLDHRLHKLGMALFAASLVSIVTFVIGYLAGSAWVRDNGALFVVLAAGLPALGASVFGIRVQGDFGASGERSDATAAALGELVAMLESKPQPLPRIIGLAEGAASIMLADLGEWRLAYQSRQLQLPG